MKYELRKRGRRLKLQRIPMELLLLLAERPGELVLRGELSRVWDSDDPGDVERSINTAVRKIRQTLGDDADHPRFVETVAGKGYRFVARVSRPESEGPVSAAEDGGPAEKRQAASGFGFGALFVAAITLVSAALWVRTAPPTRTMRVRPFTALSGSESTPAFSPDGNQVAFSWDGEGPGQHLYLKGVAGGAEVRLTASPELDSNPAWSPDGRRIAFLRGDGRHALALYVMSASGGGERKVRDFSGTTRSRLSWSADGRGLAVVDSDSGEQPRAVFVAEADSGVKRRLTTPPETGQGDSHPAYSPDGRTLAFLRNTGSLQTGTPYLLRLDGGGMALGKPTAIRSDRTDLTGIEWSADGRSLICGTSGGLVRIPIGGGAAQQLPFLDSTAPSVARLGHRLVYSHAVQETAIFRVPGPGTSGAITRLIASSRYNAAPRYSPDGRRIVFMSDRTGVDELWLTDSEGQGGRQLTSFDRATLGSPRWSPDSRRIAFDSTAEGPTNIYVIAPESGIPRRITFGGSSNVRPSWTHDGAWIYFGSNRSGAWEIWKTSPDGSPAIQVTHGGGREGVEDAEGKFLYYTKAATAPGIWRVPVSGGPAELVCDEGVQGRWEIGQRGLYYLNAQNELELRELPAGGRIVVPTSGLRMDRSSGGLLGLAPDDRWILVTSLVRSESDLFLVENFR